MDNNNLNMKISQLNKIKDIELARMEIYSIIVTMILSKEEFKTNSDIKVFLERIEVEFKDYIMKTRTLILAKLLRIIEKAESNKLKLYIEVLTDMQSIDARTNEDSSQYYTTNHKNIGKINNTKEQGNNKKKKDDNYMIEIMKKYSR